MRLLHVPSVGGFHVQHVLVLGSEQPRPAQVIRIDVVLGVHDVGLAPLAATVITGSRVGGQTIHEVLVLGHRSVELTVLGGGTSVGSCRDVNVGTGL